MRALLAAAVVLVALAVVPGVASASHGQPHGPDPTPLVLALSMAAIAGIAAVGRHAVARLARAAGSVVAEALRAVAHHRPHRSQLR